MVLWSVAKIQWSVANVLWTSLRNMYGYIGVWPVVKGVLVTCYACYGLIWLFTKQLRNPSVFIKGNISLE